MEIENIHDLGWKKIERISLTKRVENVMEGLQNQKLKHIFAGYRYNYEFEYTDFSINFDATGLIVFSSQHNGFVAFDYVDLACTHKYFNNIYTEMKKNFNRYNYQRFKVFFGGFKNVG